MTAPGRRFAYIGALDGIRGLSVLGPLLYHARPERVRGGPDILPGGFLSIDLFFVLSSFLIVSIALREWDDTGRIDLVAYAGRRARRLLPALLAAVALLTLYLVQAGEPRIVPRWTGAIVSALTYSANWHEVAAGVSYFERFDSPSPLEHLWSFAIEEQFYVFAPLFVIAGLTWFGRRGRRVLLGAALAGAVSSAVWMAFLHVPGQDPSRVYYGTDTRAQALFVGIALALAARMYGPPRTDRGRRALVAAAYPALALHLWMIAAVSERDEWMFERGGFLLVAAAGATVIYGMAQPVGAAAGAGRPPGPRSGLLARLGPSPLHRFFELAPVRYTGRISYGLYLYHWPIYLLVTTERIGALTGDGYRPTGYGLLAVHLALTFVVASASFHLIERPIVERRWPIRRWTMTPAGGALAASAAVIVVLAGLLAANATRPARIEQVFVSLPGAEAGPEPSARADSGSVASSSGLADSGSATPGLAAAAEPPSAGAEPGPTQTTDPETTVSGTNSPAANSQAPGASEPAPVGPGDDPAEPGVPAPAGGDAPAGRSPTAGAEDRQPLRVLIVGDSVSGQIGWALHDWGEENPGRIITYNESHIGCGVVRLGFGRQPGWEPGPIGESCNQWAVPVSTTEVTLSEVLSWPTALDLFRPDAVVAGVSPWDAIDRIVPGVVDEWASIGHPAYDDYVRREYEAASDLLTSTGAALYWLQAPQLDRPDLPEDHAERIAGLNRLVAEAAAAAALGDRDIVLVDYPAFIGEVGGRRDRAVRDDGAHLSDEGYEEVAPWLMGIIDPAAP